MPKMKDLGINVIPETMRPPECLPLTVGPVCPPGSATFEVCHMYTGPGPVCTPFGFTHHPGCFPTSCGVSPMAAACHPTSCGVSPAAAAFQSTATCIPNSCGVAPDAAAFQSTATCIPNSCGVACGCTHITNPCIGCTIAVTFQCITHTTITVCHTGTICPGGTCPGGSICTTGSIGTITITPTTPQLQGGGLTRESIAQLKDQLQQQIAQLDEHAKTLGPKTS
ncbi:MAG: hypothetical protein QOE82_2025, partial [Thermoanaerobaculia bacterium]|nr:hypothetical protein [Thermoanaerobaculia bacterium]